MKKKIWLTVFLAASLSMCATPFVCMSFAATNETVEKKALAPFPSLVEDGALNVQILQDMSDYFNDHFAFRQPLISANAELQSKLFGTSAADTVILGKDGWLFYKDTLEDALGIPRLSKRGVWNLSKNLALTQTYAENAGAKFLFVLTPNKSSLYGEYLPYYDSLKVSEENTRTQLEPLLRQEKIPYCDLYSLFQAQSEVLYLKEDSHWNHRGALLAYNAMLDAVGQKHDTLADAPYTLEAREIGDLAQMLYPVTAKPEENYYYEYPIHYTHQSANQSVEDSSIFTTNETEDATLLMYRDSFGNALIPFIANAFGSCGFFKGEPYSVESNIDTLSPDIVILEKCERNLRDLVYKPPVFSGLDVELTQTPERLETGTTITFSEETDNRFWQISGVLEDGIAAEDSEIFVQISFGEDSMVYQPMYQCTKDSDYGYVLYYNKGYFPTGEATVSVLLQQNDKLYCVAEQDITIPEQEEPENSGGGEDVYVVIHNQKVPDCVQSSDGEEHGTLVDVYSDGTTVDVGRY